VPPSRRLAERVEQDSAVRMPDGLARKENDGPRGARSAPAIPEASRAGRLFTYAAPATLACSASKGRARCCTGLGFTSNLGAALRTLMPPAKAALIRLGPPEAGADTLSLILAPLPGNLWQGWPVSRGARLFAMTARCAAAVQPSGAGSPLLVAEPLAMALHYAGRSLDSALCNRPQAVGRRLAKACSPEAVAAFSV
jgi:hypothetical protein